MFLCGFLLFVLPYCSLLSSIFCFSKLSNDHLLSLFLPFPLSSQSSPPFPSILSLILFYFAFVDLIYFTFADHFTFADLIYFILLISLSSISLRQLFYALYLFAYTLFLFALRFTYYKLFPFGHSLFLFLLFYFSCTSFSFILRF